MRPEHDNFFTYTPDNFEKRDNGFLVDDGEGNRLHGIAGAQLGSVMMRGGACYGVVQAGSVTIEFGKKIFMLVDGDWFTTRAGANLYLSRDAVVFLVQRAGYIGMDIVGKMEPEGRLKYIDGARDSVLFGPIKFGDPLLNALYMPAGVHQTMHTHPSTRCGMIMTGRANAETPKAVHPLEPGTIFYLPTNGRHKFRTDETKEPMSLIAWHPDSDFGPKDEDHPMLNRTIVGEKSASQMPEIQTK